MRSFWTDDSRWALVRAWLGVAPLACYAGFHAWGTYPVVHTQQAWLDRALGPRLGPWGWAVLLVVLGVHFVAATADLLARRDARRKDPARRDAWLGVEALMLVLVVCFVAYHVASFGVRTGDAQVALRAAYDRLWISLGRPAQLATYAVGITALAFHMALGLARVLTQQLGRPRLWRSLAGLAAFLVWLSFAQALGRFATGESLVPALVVGAPGR